MSAPLKDRVVLVTGAARGIGLAIAERLARDGARVALADADGPALAEAAERLADANGTAIPSAVGDLADEAAAGRAVQCAVRGYGTIDILVNNAGGGIIKPFLEQTPDMLRTTIARNLWTTIWCTWHALPIMRAKRYGRIINVGADSVRNGLWDHAAYNAAKGGVHGMTTGLAREFAQDGITVNTVAPCAVNTPQMEEVLQKNPALARKFVAVIPLGRPAEMAEVASMVSYLASKEAGFVTGQVISVNGGSTML